MPTQETVAFQNGIIIIIIYYAGVIIMKVIILHNLPNFTFNLSLSVLEVKNTLVLVQLNTSADNPLGVEVEGGSDTNLLSLCLYQLHTFRLRGQEVSVVCEWVTSWFRMTTT